MLKRIVSIVLVASLVPIPFSCMRDEVVEPPEAQEQAIETKADLEKLEAELSAAPEVQELLAMLEEVEFRMSSRGITVLDLQRLQSNKVEAASAALGYSREESDAFISRLVFLRDELYSRYPVLRELVRESMESGSATGIVELSDGSGEEDSIPPEEPKKGSRPVICKWVPFISSLLTCVEAAIALGGNPAVIITCVYQSLCAYCSGGWVSMICR